MPQASRLERHARLEIAQRKQLLAREQEVGRFDALEQLSSAAAVTRTWGDCYGYQMIATGRADAMIDPRMHVWDAAALLPILEEAGGTFTDWDGKRSIISGNGVATNGKLLQAVLAATIPRNA